MSKKKPVLRRRSILTGAAASIVASSLQPNESRAAQPAGAKKPQGAAKSKPVAANKICAFIKFVQELDYSSMADVIAEIGFDGIEATIRQGGQAPLERAVDELPKLVEALRAKYLEVTVMTTDIRRIDQPHAQAVLRTAAALGVKRYRLAYHSYDRQRSIPEQLKELRPIFRDIAQFSSEVGVTAVYQNHSGANSVGAPLWDLHRLIENESVEAIGAAFDIRHATVEGGLCWPTHFQLMRPHLAAVYVKDFQWRGRRPENVPLGTGRVDPAFFPLLKRSRYDGPISLHVEYLPKAGLQKNIAALKTDFQTLKRLLRG